MTKIEIICVGSELLNGSPDAHGPYLCGHLAPRGFEVLRVSQVSDAQADIELALKEALARAEGVILCGGLGPTLDDLTRPAMCKVLGLAMHEDAALLAKIESRFRSRGLEMPVNNRLQALLPQGAQALENESGTAPGLWVETPEKFVACLPGPPRELRPMFENELLSKLMQKAGAPEFASRRMLCHGLSESAVDQVLAGLAPASGPLALGLLAKGTHVEIRVAARGAGAASRTEALSTEILKRLEDNIYSDDGQSLEVILGSLLLAEGLTIALAESCTAGRVAAQLASVPGASQYFKMGLVTYSDESKQQLLEVPPFVLKKAGAVSKDCALAMAVGLARQSGCDYNLAITGIAGPDGGTEEKPIGLVHMALAGPGGVQHQEYRFGPSSRQDIQARAAHCALILLYRVLSGLAVQEQPSDRFAPKA